MFAGRSRVRGGGLGGWGFVSVTRLNQAARAEKGVPQFLGDGLGARMWLWLADGFGR